MEDDPFESVLPPSTLSPLLNTNVEKVYGNTTLNTSIEEEKVFSFKEEKKECLNLPEILDVLLWEYLGEGNANVVFHANLTHPEIQRLFQCTHVVLRLKKVTHQNGNDPKKNNLTLDYLTYVNTVLKPIFSKSYFPNYVKVTLTPLFLTSLQQKLKLHATSQPRPHSRTFKALDPMQSYGYLCSNYTARGVLCIELKPKWLVPLPDSKKKETFSSSSQWTMNSSSSIRSTPSTCVCECRFCLHQALKLKLKLKLNSSALIHDECSTTTTTTTTFISPSLTSTTSSCEWQWTSFCPLDLLQVSTLPKAVQGLLRSPNNNLRLFEQGHPVPLVKYPHYQHLVTQALKEVHPLLQELSMHQSQLDQLATMTLPSFSATCIHPHEKNLPCVQCLPDLMTLHEWHGFVTWYLQKQPTFSFSTSTSTSTSSITWMPSIFLFAYLLSKTLKDCSILVTVSTLDPFQVLDCVIIDVDLKPMHKLPTWLALDAELEKKDENKGS